MKLILLISAWKNNAHPNYLKIVKPDIEIIVTGRLVSFNPHSTIPFQLVIN